MSTLGDMVPGLAPREPLEVFVPAPFFPGALGKYRFLNSNHRPHWTVRAKVTKAWRAAAHLAVRRTPGLPVVDGRVHITAVFHKTRGGRYDAANLYPVAKACVDGLVDAGVLLDDSNEYVVGPDPRAGDPRPDHPGVTLLIRL